MRTSKDVRGDIAREQGKIETARIAAEAGDDGSLDTVRAAIAAKRALETELTDLLEYETAAEAVAKAKVRAEAAAKLAEAKAVVEGRAEGARELARNIMRAKAEVAKAEAALAAHAAETSELAYAANRYSFTATSKPAFPTYLIDRWSLASTAMFAVEKEMGGVK